MGLCCCSLFCADLLIVGGHVEYFFIYVFLGFLFCFILFLQTSMVITLLFGEDFASCVDVLF